MSALRKKLEAVDEALPPVHAMSKKMFVEKYGQHPGGTVAQAKEEFSIALVCEIEKLRKDVDILLGDAGRTPS